MKKVLNLVLALSLMLTSLFTFTVSAGALTPSEARNGVVYVYAQFGNIEEGRGSGFAIGQEGQPVEFIVTNAHVVWSSRLSAEATHIEVAFNYAANKFQIAEIYAIDTVNDIAVLRLSEPTTERIPLKLCPIKDFNLDDEVAALGYPLLSDVAAYFNTHGTDDVTVTRGAVSRQYRDDLKREVYLIDVKINGGNSGGPLINENGDVIGIATYTVSFTEQETGDEYQHYAICIDELFDLVTRDQVNYQLSTDAPATPTVPDVSAEPDVKDKDSDMTLVIIIAAVAVVAIVVVILVVVLSKKKAAPAASATPAPASPAAVQHSIVCVNGVLKGRSYPLASSLVIGRDGSRATVVYPTNTNGISSVHCEVRLNGDKIELIDRKSSYGTFIGSGQRLIADLPNEIKPGDYFYLGSTEQMFQVK